MSTWIQTKRKLAGISQAEVAKILGISRPTYIKLEKGDGKPTIEQKALLASIFNVSNETLDKESEAKNIVEIKPAEIPKENIGRFKQVLLYVISKVGGLPNIGQTAIYKLLYF